MTQETEGQFGAVRPNGATGTARVVEIIPYADLLQPNLTNKALVKGLIETNSVVLIVGLPGCGKTFLALDLALNVASGQEFLGCRVTRGRVIYVATEAGKSIRNRIAAWHKEHEVDEVDFAAVVSPVDLGHHAHGEESGAVALARAIKDSGGADVIIIDTVSRALAGANENSPDDMGGFVYVLDKLREFLGCTIIVVHHLGKDASRGARGHSLLYGAFDTEMTVEKRDDTSVITMTKQRDLPAAEEIGFVLRSVELGRDGEGDPVTSCVVDLVDYVPPRKAKEPTGNAKIVFDVLMQVIATKGELLEWGMRGVKEEVWRKAVEEGVFSEHRNARDAWKKAHDRLVRDDHVIRGEGGYVWPAVAGTRDDVPF
ncbi:MAG TPA: AAA family ATPase [Stellaceae bacterium]|nr:AAA family ATPase [Stellaceae bacterium]